MLEALNYLHLVCKLIHRNVTPSNILVCAGDNWKLAGLEFAVRFESTSLPATDAQSVLVGETRAAQLGCLLRLAGGSRNATDYSSGGAARAVSCGPGALRRQRTLHQTKCDEYLRASHTGATKTPRKLSIAALHNKSTTSVEALSADAEQALLQPQLDYLAPEIWRSAKCSHKSDVFSFGLVMAQTYDLHRHRPVLACNGHASHYDAQVRKVSIAKYTHTHTPAIAHKN